MRWKSQPGLNVRAGFDLLILRKHAYLYDRLSLLQLTAFISNWLGRRGFKGLPLDEPNSQSVKNSARPTPTDGYQFLSATGVNKNPDFQITWTLVNKLLLRSINHLINISSG
jgi:hypothetical protein